jgi:chromosome segregation ATPase
MLVRTFALIAALGAVGAAAWTFSPELRTRVAALWNEYTGWTEAARQANPAGFASHVESELVQDLDKMCKTRRELTAEVGRLSKTIREQRALAEQARRLAEQFRDVYQQAMADGRFPVEVQGAAYTESQVRSQVSMLLAEAEGYDAALAELEAVRTEAEAKIEELAVRINRTETQLAALATKRELLRARQLTAAGEELLAQVDELMTGNRRTIADNPVAPLRELLARAPEKPEHRGNEGQVEAFLASLPERPDAIETPSDELIETSLIQPVAPQTPVQTDVKDKPRDRKQPKTTRNKPIFQQS